MTRRRVPGGREGGGRVGGVVCDGGGHGGGWQQGRERGRLTLSLQRRTDQDQVENGREAPGASLLLQVGDTARARIGASHSSRRR